MPALIAILMLLAGSAAGQATATAKIGVREAYLARDNGGKVGEAVTEFYTSDIPIHCVVDIDSQGSGTVEMNFVAVSVAGVRPETRVVSSKYVPKPGQDRVFFTGRPAGKWTPGIYRVDLFVNGVAEKSLSFQIRKGVRPRKTGVALLPKRT